MVLGLTASLPRRQTGPLPAPTRLSLKVATIKEFSLSFNVSFAGGGVFDVLACKFYPHALQPSPQIYQRQLSLMFLS